MSEHYRKIGSKGRINIPKEIRKNFETNMFKIEVISGRIVLTPYSPKLENIEDKEGVDFE